MSRQNQARRGSQKILRLEQLEARQLMSATPWTLTGSFWTDPTHYDAVYRAGTQFDLVAQNGTQTLGQLNSKGQIALNGSSLVGSYNTAQTRILWNNDTVWEKAGSATDWFDNNLADWGLRGIVETRFTEHGGLNRQDVLDVFARAESEGTVSATEFGTLKSLVANAAALKMPDYVGDLAAKVVNGDPANTLYAGSLHVGSSSSQLKSLVGQWFLGQDRPSISSGDHYVNASGSLYTNGGPHFYDVQQGYEGDCYFLASLAETALQKPSAITSMFIDNGDGTFDVRFFHGGKADYVTVDRELPVDASGKFVYDGLGLSASSGQNDLWVELAEKAYAEANASGWFGQTGVDSYDAIGQGGWPANALSQITGMATGNDNLTAANTVSAFNAGKLVVVSTGATVSDSYIVSGHAYAFIGYNSATQGVTLFNPWGLKGGMENGVNKLGYFTMPWSRFVLDFDNSGHTLAAPTHRQPPIATESVNRGVSDVGAIAEQHVIVTTAPVAAGRSLLATATPHDARRLAAVDQVFAGWDSLDDELLLVGV